MYLHGPNLIITALVVWTHYARMYVLSLSFSVRISVSFYFYFLSCEA